MGLRVFYVCNRKVGQQRCATMIASSTWKRRHADPLATKHRWYCTVCQARYKTVNGVMVQMVHNGVDHFCRADLPPESVRQVKYASVLRTYTGATTAHALLAAIPEAAVASSTFIRPAGPTHPGTYLYDSSVLATIPMLKWESWFSDEITGSCVDV